MIDDADQAVAGCALKARKRVVANAQACRTSHPRCSGYLCGPDQDVPLEPDGVGPLLARQESLQLEDKDPAAKQREGRVRFPSGAGGRGKGGVTSLTAVETPGTNSEPTCCLRTTRT